MTLKDETTLEVCLNYCFNEFLKMCEFLKDDLVIDNKSFIEYTLILFKHKLNNTAPEELVPKEKFPLPEIHKGEIYEPFKEN